MVAILSHQRRKQSKSKNIVVPVIKAVVLVVMGANLNQLFNASEESKLPFDLPVTANADYSFATRESLGFFSDISNDAWKILKGRFQRSQPNTVAKARGYKKIYKEHANHPNYFWQENYDPEFTCPFEEKFGGLGDGGKWVCDHHRISKTDCLVYSIGSHGDFTFETDVFNKISKSCEIHTFDRDDHFNNKNFPELAKKAGVEFHHTMLGEPTKKYLNAKRFKKIIPDLKHEGRTIDLLKIDCEGCEWDQYLQWIEDFKETGVTVRQILIEVHDSPLPMVADFFTKMLEYGFVIFHKEANFLNANCVEFGFVLLDKEFQKLEPATSKAY